MKRWITVLASAALVLTLAGCASNQESGPDYADDEAVRVIEQGWNERADVLGDITQVDPNYVATMKKAVQAEIDIVSPLKDRQFEDSKLQENVIAYVNSLNNQLEILNGYSMTDPDYYTEWQESYDGRTILLKTFAEDYGLTVDPKYQAVFEELIANGTNAQNKDNQKAALDALVAGAVWDKTENYGIFQYTAIVENTSEYNYSNVGLIVNLYDADGVKHEAYANVTNWNKGEKVKFDAYGGDVDATRVEAVVQYYDVVK